VTLIAALSPNWRPMLLGDILISAPLKGGRRPSRVISLPSVGFEIPLDPNAASQIVSVQQKLLSITNNLAIGWSGNYDAARRITCSMREYFPAGSAPITLRDISNCLVSTCSYTDLHNSDVSLVGFYYNNKEINKFSFKANEINLPLFGPSSVSGKGAQMFIDACNYLASQGTSFPSEVNMLDGIACQKALTLIGYLTMHELFDTTGVYRSLSGGFYEIMLAMDNSNKTFAKLDDILYTYTKVIQDDQSKRRCHLVPLIYVKVEYWNDLLLVRRISPPHNDDDTYIISPIYRNVSMEEIRDVPRVSMNATHFCHVLFLDAGDGNIRLMVRPEMNPDIPSLAITVETGESIRIEMREDFVKEVIERFGSI
jgi:hypothetical protein